MNREEYIANLMQEQMWRNAETERYALEREQAEREAAILRERAYLRSALKYERMMRRRERKQAEAEREAFRDGVRYTAVSIVDFVVTAAVIIGSCSAFAVLANAIVNMVVG